MAWFLRPKFRISIPAEHDSSAPKKKKRNSRARRSLVNLLFGRSPKDARPKAVDKASEWLDSVANELERGPDDKPR